MKKTIYILVFMLTASFTINAQILTTENFGLAVAANSFSFLDGSSSPGYNPFPGAGKGILFPRTDLTTVEVGDVFDNATIGAPNYNPNYYDGLVVFNTGAGAIPGTGMGTSAADVAPGFYYYRNTGAAWNTGVWTSMGGGGGGVDAYTILQNTPTDTHLINAATDQELVIQLAGTADGTTTFIDLGTTNLAASAVKQFRRADVYDGTGKLVFSATGDYDILTNVFVTGNGMFNLTLLTATYNVELY